MLREIFPDKGELKTLDEVLKSVGCDGVAEQIPVYQLHTAAVPESEYQEIPDYSCIRWQESKIPLSIMAARYGLVQYKDTLSFLNDIVGSKDAEFVSAVSQFNGAKLSVLLKAPNTVVFAPGDDIQCYYTASSSHDGSGSIQLMCSPVHTKTQTILTTLDSGIIKMRHTAKVKDRLARASGLIAKMQEVWNKHADKFTKFANISLSDDDARAYFAMVVPSNADTGAEVHTRTQNVREKLFTLYKVGPSANLPSCKGTLLGGFVAALVFGDYFKTVRKSITGTSEKDAMIESRLSGVAARFKADSFAACLKIARL